MNGAGLVFGVTDPPLGAVFIGVGQAAGLLQQHFQKIANDPFDWEYNVPYDAQVDPQMDADFAWLCPFVEQYDNSNGFLPWICPHLVEAIEWSDAFTRAVGVTNDRIESCIQVGAGCEGWQRDRAVILFHQAGDWLWWLGTLHGYIAQNMSDRGINAIDPNSGLGCNWNTELVSGCALRRQRGFFRGCNDDERERAFWDDYGDSSY